MSQSVKLGQSRWVWGTCCSGAFPETVTQKQKGASSSFHCLKLLPKEGREACFPSSDPLLSRRILGHFILKEPANPH